MTPIFALVAKMMMMPPAPVAPLLQMDLHGQFAEHPMVLRVTREGRLDEGLLEFLVRESEPLDVRLAVASPMAISDIVAAGDAFAKAAFRAPALDKVKATEPRADLLAIGAYLLASRSGGSSMQARALASAAEKKAPKSFAIAMISALLRPNTSNGVQACLAARALMPPLRDPKLATDVSDRSLFAYSEIAMQNQDMCRAQGGHD